MDVTYSAAAVAETCKVAWSTILPPPNISHMRGMADFLIRVH